jgi:hypothetical protein
LVELRWCDSYDRLQPGVWRSLIVTASEDVRPGFEIQVCVPSRIRIAVRGAPVLWARVDDDYWGYEVLRTRRDRSPEIVPPVAFALVQENAERDPAGWSRAWARTFVETLSASTASPLTGGHWSLGHRVDARSGTDLSPDLVREIANQRSNGYVQWDFGDRVYPITLRELSAPDSGRVKAWRKHARAGTLPPLLLYWVSGLAADVLLDGHDRLLAASLEGTGAPALYLQALSDEEHVRDPAIRDAVFQQVAMGLAAAEKERARPLAERLARARRFLDVDAANRLLLEAFVPLQGVRSTRARPVPGGSERWEVEVREELAVQGIRDSGLLATPEGSMSHQGRRGG